MVENGKNYRQNSHLIIHCPTSKGVSKVSGASEWVSSAIEQMNEQASGPVLQFGFLVDLAHSVLEGDAIGGPET